LGDPARQAVTIQRSSEAAAPSARPTT
jgi:hypothetical protein